ncbi:MAG: hypothetical protein H6744_08775 [Deltaproteobacteria bacterium]|nr:hypothetical protein [Deltaproteobacteria bacterium]MCB9786772.1 hypothetical protein [Deltaproteobacteria bacterium]
MQRILVVAILLAAALAACDDPELYGECPFSNSIEATCESQAGNTKLTCVVAEHPFCLESVCASWQGSSTFCTRACTADSDCPELSTCQTSLDLSFCVENEVTCAGADDVAGCTQSLEQRRAQSVGGGN